MVNTGVRCMMMRGGTSKGAYFVADDLPDNPTERDELLLRAVGSPDPRQINGIGGGHPLTTKIAIVRPSRDANADVDYLFLQPSVDEALVSDRQNCGNIVAGVGPFAVERGLVAVQGTEASVRIHLLNTDSLATAVFPVHNAMPVYDGETTISGVPGSAAAVRIFFEDIAGSSSGALFPTGNVVDEVEGQPCTLIDNGMPVVVIRASNLGVSGYEYCAELDSNDALRTRLEEIRLAAGEVMNLGDVATTTIPKLALVSRPRDGGTICTRTFIPHRCHEAIGVLGAVSVATAALVPGTTAASVAEAGHDGSVLIEHPSGHFEATVSVSLDETGAPLVSRAGIVRTARKLMDGIVYPRSKL